MAEQTKTTAVATREARPPTFFEQIEQEFDDMRRRMMSAFRRPFAPLYGAPLLRDTSWAPTADAYEKDGALIVKAELPGVKKEDINVTVRDSVLTVEGQRKEEKEVKEARYYTAERFSGAFARSFSLPKGVDANAITADYKDGVLEVHVPLPAEATAEPATIPVKS